MKVIRARLSDDVHDCPENVPILGVVIVRLDLEFLDGVGDRWNRPGAAAVVGIDDAIHIPGIRSITGTVHRWTIDNSAGNSYVAAVGAANAVAALSRVDGINARLKQ